MTYCKKKELGKAKNICMRWSNKRVLLLLKIHGNYVFACTKVIYILQIQTHFGTHMLCLRCFYNRLRFSLQTLQLTKMYSYLSILRTSWRFLFDEIVVIVRCNNLNHMNINLNEIWNIEYTSIIYRKYNFNVDIYNWLMVIFVKLFITSRKSKMESIRIISIHPDEP